jgi:hypothetical protein
MESIFEDQLHLLKQMCSVNSDEMTEIIPGVIEYVDILIAEREAAIHDVKAALDLSGEAPCPLCSLWEICNELVRSDKEVLCATTECINWRWRGVQKKEA